jgi:hypothetical protein
MVFQFLQHLLLLMYLGRMAVRIMFFPYGSQVVYRMLDAQLNESFGREFHVILERTYNAISKNMRGD